MPVSRTFGKGIQSSEGERLIAGGRAPINWPARHREAHSADLPVGLCPRNSEPLSAGFLLPTAGPGGQPDCHKARQGVRSGSHGHLGPAPGPWLRAPGSFGALASLAECVQTSKGLISPSLPADQRNFPLLFSFALGLDETDDQ